MSRPSAADSTSTARAERIGVHIWITMTSSGPSLQTINDSARPADSVQLYDVHRRVHYGKPTLRGWSHLIWFGLWLVVAPLTIALNDGSTRVIALAIYLASLGGLLG